MGRVPQALYSTLTNSLPNVIAMYGMTIAMKFKKMPPGVKIAKNDLLLDVWGWFIITTAAGILLLPKTSPCKRFMAIAPGQTSKSGCQKCFVNSISMSLCGNKIQVSSKKHLFHEIIEITMLKPKPYGRMALDDYAQSVALALQHVVQTDLGHLTQEVCFIPSLIVHAKA